MTDEVTKETKKATPKISKEQEEKNVVTYNKFADLKLLMWNGKEYEKKRLKEATLKEFEKLEKEVATFKGAKPKVSATVFMEIGEPNQKIIEGYAPPQSIYKRFVDAGLAKRYF